MGRTQMVLGGAADCAWETELGNAYVDFCYCIPACVITSSQPGPRPVIAQSRSPAHSWALQKGGCCPLPFLVKEGVEISTNIWFPLKLGLTDKMQCNQSFLNFILIQQMFCMFTFNQVSCVYLLKSDKTSSNRKAVLMLGISK